MILLTDAGTQETKLGWFANDETKLSRESSASVPSSMPKGTTQRALSGASMPGTAGIALSIPM